MFTNGTPMWDLADYYDVGDYDDCDDGGDGEYYVDCVGGVH